MTHLPSPIGFEAGSIYSQNYILTIKPNLEVLHGAKLKRKCHFIIQDQQRTLDSVELLCKNAPRNKCSFKYFFKRVIDADNGDEGYTLNELNPNHNDRCVFCVEEKRFLELNRIIDEDFGHIKDLLCTLLPHGSQSLPRIILNRISLERGGSESQPYIYDGLSDRFLCKRIKKKFDNVVAAARRTIQGQVKVQPLEPFTAIYEMDVGATFADIHLIM